MHGQCKKNAAAQLQRIAFQKVWCEEMTEEQIMGELGVNQQD